MGNGIVIRGHPKRIHKNRKHHLCAMKQLFVLFVAVLMIPLTSAETAGEDIAPDVESTPFSTVNYQTPSRDGVKWTIEFSLDEDLNYSSIELTTQICTNDGVCDSPDTITFSEGPFTKSVTPPDDHTYVNWRMKVIEGENSTKYPSSKWYKIWSECWYDVHEKKWGGDNCNNEDNEEEDSFLPFTSLGAMLMITLIAAKTRRDDQ